MQAGLRGAGTHALPIHRMPHRSPKNAHPTAAIFGILGCNWNPLRRKASSIPEPFRSVKWRSRFDQIQCHFGETSMVITAAHIPAIVALIAGILILLMPRLLNLVVAIYLICVGLIGLGALRIFHM
jgi:hypothetical protein